ncbi:dihydroorotate oxidase B electron transfer subunit [Humitalea rosea]|uniref:Dihydroorotate oxidase B electron transfer subunit n=1 Tax=Humitalea rosea TaxID=990373 RepID=A0A2W7IRP8_9PROT|nr:dihydroorotate dehydrogenase electron transfer subunit [Humitalea rosea]PZW48787.1 dihydroorotate oxidase B electron transfer subunit [Humitalea rosea]
MDGSAGPFPVTTHLGRVIASVPVGARYHRLLAEAPALSAAVEPGQFCHLLCPGAYLRRPMSVWRAGAQEPLGFLFRVAGPGTAALAGLREGDTLDAMGPLGRGFTLDPGWGRILVLARGVGLATLSLLARRAVSLDIGVTAILSARDPADMMAEAFCGAVPMDLRLVHDSDGSSDPAAVGMMIEAEFIRARPDAVFTCGSDRLLRLLQEIAARHGVLGEAAIEQRMGCALGLCFACVRRIATPDGPRDLRVCREGPVFDLQSVEAW